METVGRTAVATSDSSASSYFPPGKAVWPGYERRFFDRVVSNTLKDPFLPNNKINTAPRLLTACSGLHITKTEVSFKALAKRGPGCGGT